MSHNGKTASVSTPLLAADDQKIITHMKVHIHSKVTGSDGLKYYMMTNVFKFTSCFPQSDRALIH